VEGDHGRDSLKARLGADGLAGAWNVLGDGRGKEGPI
jgi:hypothetical protein